MNLLCIANCFALGIVLACAPVIGFTPLEVSGLCIREEAPKLAAQSNSELGDHYLRHILARLQCPSRPIEGAEAAV